MLFLLAPEMRVMAQNVPCSFISFLHSKDIIYYFSSLSVNSDHFQLTKTLSATLLLLELMGIKHGNHVVLVSIYQRSDTNFLLFFLHK